MSSGKYMVFPPKEMVNPETEKRLLWWTVFCPEEGRTLATCRELKDAELIVNALNSMCSAVETIKMYHDAWKSLYDVMCDFGMNPKSGPEEMVGWLRDKLENCLADAKAKKEACPPEPLLVVIDPVSEEDGGGWLAQVVDLPGCMSDGKTPAEALKNVLEAKEAWVKTAKKRGLEISPVDESRLAVGVSALGFFEQGPYESVLRKLEEMQDKLERS